MCRAGRLPVNQGLLRSSSTEPLQMPCRPVQLSQHALASRYSRPRVGRPTVGAPERLVQHGLLSQRSQLAARMMHAGPMRQRPSWSGLLIGCPQRTQARKGADTSACLLLAPCTPAPIASPAAAPPTRIHGTNAVEAPIKASTRSRVPDPIFAAMKRDVPAVIAPAACRDPQSCGTRLFHYMQSIITWPKPEQLTCVAPSIRRAKS